MPEPTPDYETLIAHAYDPEAFEHHPIEERSHVAAIQWAARRHIATEAAKRALPAVEALLADKADAVETLVAENEKLRQNRGWDGEWRTLHQTEEEARRILMRWTKAQLVNAHVADWQRDIRNENWVAERLVKMTEERDALRGTLENEKKLRAYEKAALVRINAERDALQAQLDSMTVEFRPVRVETDKKGRIREVVIPRFVQRLVSEWTEVTEGDAK